MVMDELTVCLQTPPNYHTVADSLNRQRIRPTHDAEVRMLLWYSFACERDFSLAWYLDSRISGILLIQDRMNDEAHGRLSGLALMTLQ
jgi:hypothetical protein